MLGSVFDCSHTSHAWVYDVIGSNTGSASIGVSRHMGASRYVRSHVDPLMGQVGMWSGVDPLESADTWVK